MPKGNTEAFDLSVIIGQIAVRLQHFRPPPPSCFRKKAGGLVDLRCNIAILCFEHSNLFRISSLEFRI
jgi:hypothetical protein